MGASDWAGEMVKKMHEEFGVGQERAIQVTNRVRKVAAEPDCRKLQDAGILDASFDRIFISNLIESLAEQEGETLESRWNNLVREFGLYDILGQDILLYDPADSRFDEEQTLVSDDGDTITLQKALLTAWERGIPVEETENGIRLGNTLYRSEDASEQTLLTDIPESTSEPSNSYSRFDPPLDQSRLDADTTLLTLEDVEFPESAPASDCFAAVAAARRYIRDNGGATREEVLDALRPAENYPIGVSGAQAKAKGFTLDFQDWWWNQIIEPGLRALRDIEPPTYENGRWYPDDVFEEGFESGDQVKELLEEGYLFEVAFEDGGDTRRFLAIHDEITRPAATPLHGPPAFRFRTLGGDETVKIRLPELVEQHPVTPERLPAPIRDTALEAIATFAKQNSDRIPDTDIQLVLRWLKSDEVDADVALTLLGTVLNAQSNTIPETVLDDLETLLTRRSALFTDEASATDAAKCAALLAESDPTRIIDVVPVLVTAAESGTVETQQWVMYALSNVADEYPEELMPALDSLVDGLESDDDNVRTNALTAVGRIAGSYPDAAAPLTSRLVELLDVDEEKTRANAVGLLGDIAQTQPETVVEYAPEIASCLNADDDQSRINASIALLRAGEADPQAISNEAAQLEAALEDSHPAVRANTCTLIGNAGVTDSVERLEELANNDPDDEVQERAAWAVDRLS